MKSSAKANSNIALIKYWGKSDPELKTPLNPSISMTMDGLTTHTTIEFGDFNENEIILNGKTQTGKSLEKILEHIERIKRIAGSDLKCKMVSENNFPTAAGLASSASGFAALTVAAADALGLDLSKKELSILSRQGSGSSCRSIHGGYVEWFAGDSQESYANQIADENHFDIRNIIAVVNAEEKKISSRIGMEATVKTSPLHSARLEAVKKTFPVVRNSILEKDFETLGKISEHDMLIMHATMMTTKPTLFYFAPATISILQELQSLREEGVLAYATIDAGPNVHVLTLPENEMQVAARLKAIEGVKELLHTKPGKGAEIVKENLF